MQHYQSALIEIASLDHRDFDTTIASILRTDAEVIGVDRVSFWMTEGAEQTLRCELGYLRRERTYERGAVLSAHECPAYFASVLGEKVIDAGDAVHDPRTSQLADTYLVPHGIGALMDAPVWLDGRLIGIVCHEHVGPPRRWSERDRAFALSAAQAVAMAVGARERRRAQRAEERAEFLAKATMILAESLDLQAIPKRLVSLALPVLGDWCVLDACRDGDELERVASAHVDPAKHETLQELARRYPPSPESPALTARAVREEHALLVPEITPELLERSTVDAAHAQLFRTLGSTSGMAVPLRAHGRVLGAIAFVSGTRRFDIEDLRLAEDLAQRAAIALENARLHRQAQDAVAARDEFLSVAAHELYTPLSALMLSAEQLERTRPDESRTVRTIVRNTQRLTQLVNALLDAVRTGFRRVPMTYRHVDLIALTRAVMEEQQESAERAGTQVSLSADAPVFGLWDEGAIEQVLANLLSNAIKFGAGKPVEVTVAQLEDRARVTVRDHGPGIEPEELPRIFARFERGVSRRSYGGLGLGLYIARGIAEAHGGALRAESQLGQGATFTLDLPLAPR